MFSIALVSQDLWRIEGDHKGRLWLSTVDGLIGFDPDHGDVYR